MEHIQPRLAARPCVGHTDKRGDNRVQIAVRFTDHQFKEIIKRADESQRPAAAIIRELIDKALR
jgi:hypothetical protein